jgi:hypothetical protein
MAPVRTFTCELLCGVIKTAIRLLVGRDKKSRDKKSRDKKSRDKKSRDKKSRPGSANARHIAVLERV